MSDTAALERRLAQMEAELSRYRSAPQAPQFDPVAFRQAFTADPVGVLTRMGAPVEHVTRVLVANAMGDAAPPELKALAAMGPQVSAVQALESKVEALSRQLSVVTDPKPARIASLKALTADKSKFPALAKALEADPSLLDEMASAGDEPEAVASRLETRFSKLLPSPPASTNAEPPVQSTQDKPTGVVNDGVPPIQPKPVGAFTPADHEALKAEIVRKHTSTAP